MTCAGLGPALAVSRLSRATRRSHGSLPQHVSRRAFLGSFALRRRALLDCVDPLRGRKIRQNAASDGKTHSARAATLSERRDCERSNVL